MLLAIDPGVHSGWALFGSDGLLLLCGLGVPRGGHVDDVVIERPVIYPHGRTRNPNDVVTLAVNAGECAGLWRARGARVHYVEPRAWKGTINADICNWRIMKSLNESEARIVSLAASALGFKPGTKRPYEGAGHNMVDAIGIGLHLLGRGMLKPAKTLAQL